VGGEEVGEGGVETAGEVVREGEASPRGESHGGGGGGGRHGGSREGSRGEEGVNPRDGYSSPSKLLACGPVSFQPLSERRAMEWKCFFLKQEWKCFKRLAINLKRRKYYCTLIFFIDLLFKLRCILVLVEVNFYKL
jgi:hypothetical protein